ncbi:hypothetical protein OG875_23410 [Streptomyces sp. NBC_01498]|uniref:hypothetical protein n=1 Tax=Streptomyces sp. NBC_01498 TaxID=2975870 RepID=UPI002E7B7CDF|nr:hypothetical protein [Streptomyces sp. NBC_01498]WTL27254.1 hypothetical protein OG875_23410 [Streptomyces sp. NBC_01498]
MGSWFQQNFVEPGKVPMLLALVSFVLTFVITRTITRLIRAGRGPFRNIGGSGGLHIHHVVPGVLLMVIGGFGAVGSGRHGVGAAVWAVVFGAGAGLVLDEFALILHLDDVYWTEDGRRSVEVVVLAAALALLVLSGFSPLDVDSLSPEERQDRASVLVSLAISFGFVLITLLKGKLPMALVGVLVPPVAIVGALRLARPGSVWARRFYRRRHRARARMTLRAYHRDRRWSAPRRRVQDWIGGAPDDERAERAAKQAPPH